MTVRRDQRFAALEAANDIRFRRVHLKRAVRARTIRVEELVLNPEWFLHTLPVHELLEWAPKVGRTRVIAVAEDPDQRPVESGRLRRREREADQAATADSDGEGELGKSGLGGQPHRWPNLGRGAAATAADPDRHPVRDQPEPECGSCRPPVARGVAVEWGIYERAIRRWEAIHGPAPEPLVRRVDDGRAAWVERSQLSALGDGVQVQLGEMVGRYLMEIA